MYRHILLLLFNYLQETLFQSGYIANATIAAAIIDEIARGIFGAPTDRKSTSNAVISKDRGSTVAPLSSTEHEALTR